jgi:hypothetical protein
MFLAKEVRTNTPNDSKCISSANVVVQVRCHIQDPRYISSPMNAKIKLKRKRNVLLHLNQEAASREL